MQEIQNFAKHFGMGFFHCYSKTQSWIEQGKGPPTWSILRITGELLQSNIAGAYLQNNSLRASSDGIWESIIKPGKYTSGHALELRSPILNSIYNAFHKKVHLP